MDEKVNENANINVNENIDNRKVQALAQYIAGLLKDNDLDADEITRLVTEDIINNYSRIMNSRLYDGFDCTTLENVRELWRKSAPVSRRFFRIKMEKTRIVSESRLLDDDDRYDIIWMIPERIKEEYERVMGSIKERKEANNIVISGISQRAFNPKEKKALRRYIKENGIEGINTDIEPLEVDHEMTNAIADCLMDGFRYTDEDKKKKILAYLENNWSEILGEDQDIKFCEIHEAVFGESIVNFDMIYLTDGMAYFDDCINHKVIYATPEALKRTATATEKRISEYFLSAYLSELRRANQAYANEHGIELEEFDLSKDGSGPIKEAIPDSEHRSSELNNLDEKTTKDDDKKQPPEGRNDVARGKKNGKDGDVILPEDLKRRGKQHMMGCQAMLKRLQDKIDSGEIVYGHKTKVLTSLHRTLCELRDKEAAAKNLSQEYQNQLPKEAKEDR